MQKTRELAEQAKAMILWNFTEETCPVLDTLHVTRGRLHHRVTVYMYCSEIKATVASVDQVFFSKWDEEVHGARGEDEAAWLQRLLTSLRTWTLALWPPPKETKLTLPLLEQVLDAHLSFTMGNDFEVVNAPPEDDDDEALSIPGWFLFSLDSDALHVYVADTSIRDDALPWTGFKELFDCEPTIEQAKIACGRCAEEYLRLFEEMGATETPNLW